MEQTQSLNSNLTQKAKREEMIRNYLTTVPEGATPKMIAFYTRIPQSTVRGMLMRGVPGVEVIEGLHLYRTVHKNRDNHIFSYNFHNLILAVYIPNYQGNQVNETHSLSLINSEFIIGEKSKQATMRISTPKANGTDYPLNTSSIELVFILFKKLVKEHTGIDITEKDTQVRSIEFNKDYENLKLEGVNCITFDNLITQFKAYQKNDKLRMETRVKVPINAEQLIKLLGISPLSQK